MSCINLVHVNLVLIAPVVLLITDDGDVTVLVYSGCKDNHVTRFIVVVGCDTRTFTLKVPLIVVLYVFAIQMKLLFEFLLLTVFQFLHTVIDGEVFEPCIPLDMYLGEQWHKYKGRNHLLWNSSYALRSDGTDI